MKKNMLMMFGALMFAFAGVSARAAETIHGDSVAVFTPNFEGNFDVFQANLYLNTAFKINNSWGIVPEILLINDITKGGDSNLGSTLKYARVVFTGPVLKSYGEGREFSLQYRYLLPMDSATQQAGSLGAFKIRPQLTWKFTERFSLFTRAGMSINFQRNNYQLYSKTMGKAGKDDVIGAGNNLLSWDVELLPSFKISETVSLGANINPALILVGAAKGKSGVTTKAPIVHEYSVTIAAFGLEFAPTIGHESNLKDFKFFTKAGLNVYMDIGKKF